MHYVSKNKVNPDLKGSLLANSSLEGKHGYLIFSSFFSFFLPLPPIRQVPGYCGFRKFKDLFNISRNRLDLKNLHPDIFILFLRFLGDIICIVVLGTCI